MKLALSDVIERKIIEEMEKIENGEKIKILIQELICDYQTDIDHLNKENEKLSMWISQLVVNPND